MYFACITFVIPLEWQSFLMIYNLAINTKLGFNLQKDDSLVKKLSEVNIEKLLLTYGM